MSAAHSTGNATNIVGVHYRVGKKIGEGSFGVIFEGQCSLALSPLYPTVPSGLIIDQPPQVPISSIRRM